MTEYQVAGFGETLRSRREQLGLSLNDVAVRTRVRKSYLQALEEENLAALPGSAYAIGFLRIYARHLGIAVEPLAVALTGKSDPGGERKLLTSGEGGSVVTKRSKVRGRKIWQALLLVVLVVVAVGGYLFYRQSQPPTPTPVKPVTAPVAAVVQPLPVQPQPLPAASAPAAVPAPEVVALPVLPPDGAVVRVVTSGAGVMKVTLDGQESRDYELQSGQKLNWKVSNQLLLELSAPALVRCWVGEQEVPLAENVAVRLVRLPSKPAERQ
jgi:cytoskeletal protein RodZ